MKFFWTREGSQIATMVVLLVTTFQKMRKAFLIRNRLQGNFAYTLDLGPYTSSVPKFDSESGTDRNSAFPNLAKIWLELNFGWTAAGFSKCNKNLRYWIFCTLPVSICIKYHSKQLHTLTT